MSHVAQQTAPAGLDPGEQQRLRAAVQRFGALRVAAAAGVHRSAVERGAAGTPVLRGTAALLRAYLAKEAAS